MKISTSSTVDAPPGEVWIVIQDPENMPAWNPKCIRVSGTNGAGAGTAFEAAFSMGSQEQVCLGKIVEWMPETRIVFSYQFEETSGKKRLIRESFSIEPVGGNQSKVLHVVDLTHSGLPRWVQVLASLLNRFGRKMGPGALDGIASLLK